MMTMTSTHEDDDDLHYEDEDDLHQKDDEYLQEDDDNDLHNDDSIQVDICLFQILKNVFIFLCNTFCLHIFAQGYAGVF